MVSREISEEAAGNVRRDEREKRAFLALTVPPQGKVNQVYPVLRDHQVSPE